jgi:class I fructose-bisphosphate aldolase
MYGSVEQAFDLGAAGVGATIYFGSDQATRQLQEVTEAFGQAHQLGMFTVLWCYLRNPAFKQGDVDCHNAADLTGQANHMGVTIEADIIKQKLPTNNGGIGLISGRKAFQRPMAEGVELLNAIQDVYLESSVTVA